MLWIKLNLCRKEKSLGKNVKLWAAMMCINQRTSGWSMIQLFSRSSGPPHAHSCEKPIQDLLFNDPLQTRATNKQRVRMWAMLTSHCREMTLKRCYYVTLGWEMLNLLHSLVQDSGLSNSISYLTGLKFYSSLQKIAWVYFLQQQERDIEKMPKFSPFCLIQLKFQSNAKC